VGGSLGGGGEALVRMLDVKKSGRGLGGARRKKMTDIGSLKPY
jgi:hypothetical protein